MTIGNARTPAHSLFTDYAIVFKSEEIQMIEYDLQKHLDEHVLNAVRKKSLQKRIEADLGVQYAGLK